MGGQDPFVVLFYVLRPHPHRECPQGCPALTGPWAGSGAVPAPKREALGRTGPLADRRGQPGLSAPVNDVILRMNHAEGCIGLKVYPPQVRMCHSSS